MFILFLKKYHLFIMKLIKVLQTVTKIEVKWTESEEKDDVII